MKTFKVSKLGKNDKLTEIATVVADGYSIESGFCEDVFSIQFFDVEKEGFFIKDDIHLPVAYFPPTEKWIITS